MKAETIKLMFKGCSQLFFKFKTLNICLSQVSFLKFPNFSNKHKNWKNFTTFPYPETF